MTLWRDAVWLQYYAAPMKRLEAKVATGSIDTETWREKMDELMKSYHEKCEEIENETDMRRRR